MTELRIVSAQPRDLGWYIDLLESVAVWLETQGIEESHRGDFRRDVDYYAESINRGEVHLAFIDDGLVGTLRILLRDPYAWPEIVADDSLYVYNLAVHRQWAGHQLGRRMLEWAEAQAKLLGRTYLRLDHFAHNEFLRCYYQVAGFVDRGVIMAQYPPPVGTLRLRRYEKAV